MRIHNNQSGFSLLILLLALMGFGGFALANYSQDLYKQVEENRFEQNKEVLKKAKEALLMYAYRYPQFNNEGPGRLPCPDTVGLDGVGDLTAVSCDLVGRFPWNHPNINFYEAKDSSGEHLWYAVSDQFFNLGGGPIVNSDNVGSITIFDQTGNLVYDGSVTGIAAVIIAPGSALAGQDRVANPLDPANYLDAFAGFDNSAFVNGSGAVADGFRLGPVYDPVQNIYAINDQFVVVTANEVIAMAEKATLDEYQQSIQAYLTNTGNIYPWLFDYNVDDLDTYSAAAANATLYPDGALTNIGRVPSIFGEYFDDIDSDQFDSEVLIEVNKTFDVNGSTYSLNLSEISSTAMTDVEFADDGAAPNDDVQFTASANGGVTYTGELYFYDATFPSGDWQLCPGPGADELSDCNMASPGVYTAGINSFTSRILIVGVSVDFSNDIQINLDTTPAPVLAYVAPTAGYNHARVNATFLSAAITNIGELPSNFYYRIANYSAGGAFAQIDFDSQLLLDNSPFAVPGIINQVAGDVTLGVRYYPVLPSWVKSNNWHRSIMMAIAPDYLPDGSGSNDCLTNPPCLTVSDIGGTTNDKGYLLTIAGSVAALTDTGAPGFDWTDLEKIFDPENADLDTTFLRREGDDTVLVVR